MVSGKGSGIRAGVLVAVFVLALMCWGIVYQVIEDDCEERGGHMETVWGGRTGWTCDGARR